MGESDMNTPLCIHLRKASRRFHFNAVLQVVPIVTLCHESPHHLLLQHYQFSLIIIYQYMGHGQCHLLSGFTEGRVVKESVAIRRAWTPMAEQPAGDVRALTVHDRVGVVGMARVVKTPVGDDSRLVAGLALVVPGQRLEGAAVPLGNVGSGRGGFPRGVGVQGRCSMPVISPRPPVVQNFVNAGRSAQPGNQTIVDNTGGRDAVDCRRQPSWAQAPAARAICS